MPMDLDSILQSAVDNTDETVDETVFDDGDEFDDELEMEPEANERGNQTDDNPDLERIAALKRRFGDNWYERVEGLQGSLQRSQEELNRLRTETNAERERRHASENALFEARIAGMPADQQQMARQQLKTYRELEEAKAIDEARAAELSSRDEMLDQMAKEIIVTRLSETYGIKRDQLSRFNDPDAMVEFAKAVSEERKSSRKKQRSQAGADRFEGGRASAPPPKKTYDGDLDAASLDFAKLRLPTVR